MKTLRLIVLLMTAGLLRAEDIVLYDVAVTPLASVQQHSKSSIEVKNGVLEITTKGNTGYPGIVLKGNWDLSKCGRVSVEMVNLDNKGSLPITLRLDNPGANAGKSQGVFVDRISILGKTPKAYSIALPPKVPHIQEFRGKFFGMRKGPLDATGVISDLDPSKVVAVALYIKKPMWDWKWGVKRIVAHSGGQQNVSRKWLNMTTKEFFPFIDVYGQFKYKDWPGKIHKDAELQQARKLEEADLKAHPGPTNWSKFGGWADGPKRKATGHFRVEKIDGKWWMVDPEGYLYWSHGPVRVTPSTAITPLDNRDMYFTDLPKMGTTFAKFYTTRDELLHPYYVKRDIKRTYDFSSANCYRKYGENYYDVFADLAHRRLRSWGMNTIANSSDKKICVMDRTPYTDRFELKSKRIEGSHDGWWPFRDPFDPSFRADVRRQMNIHKQEMDDPWCFGFFVDNELSWGKETDLAAWTLESPADQAAKVEFMNRMKAKYSTIKKLNDVWGTTYANWQDFLKVEKRPGKGAEKDLTEFTLVIADAYFRNIREEFKKVAPNKLYMGCRFAGGGNALGREFVIRMAAKHCDIVSFNIYAHSLKNQGLPKGIDKPMMIGEFHFGALDRGLFHTGLVPVKDQEARGKAYTDYVTSALDNPLIVGVHWHQFGDQATTGRFDGENFQVGFVDCCNTPYPETIAGIREVGYKMYEIRSNAK